MQQKVECLQVVRQFLPDTSATRIEDLAFDAGRVLAAEILHFFEKNGGVWLTSIHKLIHNPTGKTLGEIKYVAMLSRERIASEELEVYVALIHKRGTGELDQLLKENNENRKG